MNFVEQATLKLNDQSSSPLRKINRELKLLFKTANALKSKNFTIRASLVGYNQTIGQLKTLNAAGASLARPIRMKVNNAALTRTKRLLQDADYYAKQLNGASINVGGGGGRGNGNGGGHLTLGRLVTGFTVVSAVMNVQSAIFNTAKEGYKQNAVSEFALRSQQLSKPELASINKAIDGISDGQKFASRDQIKKLFTENVFSTLNADGSINNESNAFLTKQMLSLIKTQVAAGGSSEQAFEGAYNYTKAAAQSGALNDEKGNFDPTAAAGFFDNVRRAQIMIGKELTGEFVRTNMKYLRASKYTLDNNAKLVAMLMQEETGTSGPVGMNQLIKQLSLERLDDTRRANLSRLGLITGEKTKKNKKGKRVNVKGSGSIVDEETLRTNPSEWIGRYAPDAMKKLGLNPSNPVDAAKFAGMLTSDRTATEALTGLIVQAGMYAAQLKRIADRNPTEEQATKNADGSPLTAIQGVENQFQGLFGTLLSALNEDFVLPGAGLISGMLKTAQDFITNDDGTVNKQNAKVAAVGAGGGVVTGVYLIKKAFDLFSGTGANTSATLANTDALIANTLAQGGVGGGGGYGGGDGKKGKLPKKVPVAGGKLGLIGMALGLGYDAIFGPKDGKPLIDLPALAKPHIDAFLKGIGVDPNAPLFKPPTRNGKPSPYNYPVDGRRPAASATPDKPAYTPKNESNFSLDGNQLTEKYADSISAAGSTFGTNATLQLAPAGTAFGTNAQGGLIAGAASWGQQAGAALAAAIAGLQIGVNAQGVQINPRAPASVNGPAARARPDTGSQSIKAGPR